MKSENWKDIAELLGMAAIVASLIFVGVQVKQEKQIAINEQDLSILDSRIEVKSELNSHADIWIKANAGESLSESESFIFGNLVNSINLKAFFNHERALRLGQDAVATIILQDFAAFLYENPIARQEWLAQELKVIEYRITLQGENQFSYWLDGIQKTLASLDDTGQ